MYFSLHDFSSHSNSGALTHKDVTYLTRKNKGRSEQGTFPSSQKGDAPWRGFEGVAGGEAEDVAWKEGPQALSGMGREMRSCGRGGGHLFIGVEEEEPDLWFPL